MHTLEKLASAIRHSQWLEHADSLWSKVRPVYEEILALMFRNGVERVINGSDRVRLLPRYRGIAEVYEPEVWHHVMRSVRPGDVVADVGAHVGLYTLALGDRVRPGGRVVAFEPDPATFAALESHVALNRLADVVEPCESAVGARDGFLAFAPGREYESRVITSERAFAETMTVRAVRLDSFFGDARLDLLKIDVEGYEEAVLRGAERIMSDAQRRPRAIYVEVHPYAWPEQRTTSASLLTLLRGWGYSVVFLSGAPVREIERYGEILALDPAAATNTVEGRESV
jgi:FkbM family methyltransferase